METRLPPGRELDALIAERVFGWTVSRNELNGYEVVDDEYAIGFPPDVEVVPNVTVPYEIEAYSTDIAAAWQVVEKMRERGMYVSVDPFDDFYEAVVIFAVGGEIATATYPTAPQAICLAALEAIDASTED